MERIDQIVKEDGWVQDDEIDYNQKLVFSDDDSDTPPSTSRKDAKRVNFNDKEARAQRELEMRAGKFTVWNISQTIFQIDSFKQKNKTKQQFFCFSLQS